MNAYEKLVSIIAEDTKENLCFNENKCTHEGNCMHEYCDKLSWIKTRAKEYGSFLNVNWLDIVESWESKRSYWYMNYYQECNQPSLSGISVRVFDTVDDFFNSINKKHFRCPSCNGISTDPYECNSGIKVNDKICDWKVYGLFKDLGRGVFVYIKQELHGQTIFMPVDWEEANEKANK